MTAPLPDEPVAEEEPSGARQLIIFGVAMLGVMLVWQLLLWINGGGILSVVPRSALPMQVRRGSTSMTSGCCFRS